MFLLTLQEVIMGINCKLKTRIPFEGPQMERGKIRKFQKKKMDFFFVGKALVTN